MDGQYNTRIREGRHAGWGDGATDGDVLVRVRSDGRHWWLIARPSATGRSGWDGVVGGRPLGRRVWLEGGRSKFFGKIFLEKFFEGTHGEPSPPKSHKKGRGVSKGLRR